MASTWIYSNVKTENTRPIITCVSTSGVNCTFVLINAVRSFSKDGMGPTAEVATIFNNILFFNYDLCRSVSITIDKMMKVFHVGLAQFVISTSNMKTHCGNHRDFKSCVSYFVFLSYWCVRVTKTKFINRINILFSSFVSKIILIKEN